MNNERPRRASRRTTSARRLPEHTPRKQQPQNLVWVCDECGKPVGDGAGWVTISYAEIGTYRRDEAAWEKKHCTNPHGFNVHRLSDLMELPEPVVWHVWHKACDPDIDSSDYFIHIERIRTVAELLEWTSHLMEKTWLPSTTWRDVLRGHAEGLRRAA